MFMVHNHNLANLESIFNQACQGPSEIMHLNGSTLSPVEPCGPLCRNSDEIRDVSRIIR